MHAYCPSLQAKHQARPATGRGHHVNTLKPASAVQTALVDQGNGSFRRGAHQRVARSAVFECVSYPQKPHFRFQFLTGLDR